MEEREYFGRLRPRSARAVPELLSTALVCVVSKLIELAAMPSGKVLHGKGLRDSVYGGMLISRIGFTFSENA